VYITEWNKDQFIEFSNILFDQGLVENQEKYQAGQDAPDYLSLHMIPFDQGMLYVGSGVKLSMEQVALVQSLANAFEVAYARYEDFRELEQAKEKVEGTLTELRAAQDQLVHSEKMASLGELTAGIAHEIQNPLNFVNNFSDINKELAEELLEEIQSGNPEEAKQILEDIINNEDKIHHHGKRAEEIVRSMLLHSRGSAGEKELTDINALADEYMRLSYHGMRAKDKSFNADFKMDLYEGLPKMLIVQQDIGRVLLNLINNAFYATNEKAKKLENGRDYKPIVTLSTKHVPLGRGIKGEETIEISVKDNGNGIPKHVRDKIFQPFFSTKPTGQGTGLGLSLSFDIITKGHGGTIDVKSKVGKGTEFIIILPVE
jgi:signal transduction histidine kinase